uniref:AlNc14C266G9889 protein n=1 Tax=Albugo laibachii Nc14 TaxID=890382 RepID=F0WU65_9STRA|nr:AlNc14C266G9889 [Albugo laibachii Nc14]|eukprot:CCA24943.1 AlNc14C266G9889 [Albugo laibachii Nc14]
MHVAGMNVEQQETELFSAGTSTERDLNCEVSQKGYAIVTTRTSCEMDDKLLTTHVIVEASIETTTEFQKKQEFVRVKSAFSLIFLLKGSNHKKKTALGLLQKPVTSITTSLSRRRTLIQSTCACQVVISCKLLDYFSLI